MIGFGEVEERLKLSQTAARNMTYPSEIPARRLHTASPSGVRLWRRADVDAFLEGRRVGRRRPNGLQVLYLDSRGAAESSA